MIENNFKYSEITDLIIRSFYNVYNKLGYGFLEKVYENAFKYELGFQFNFGKQAQFKRKIFTNDKKHIRVDSSDS